MMMFMYSKRQSPQKQWRLHWMMLVSNVLQIVASTDTLHLMAKTDWIKAKERCSSLGGRLASWKDVTKMGDVVNASCNVTKQKIWLNNVQIVTPYLSQKGSILMHGMDDDSENITRCFLHCHLYSEFHYSDRSCLCNGTDINKSTNLFKVEEMQSGQNGTEESIRIFICVENLQNNEVNQVYISSTPSRTQSLQTACRDSHNDKIFLLNTTYLTWREAQVACSSYGGFLPVSLDKEDCRLIIASSGNFKPLWSGTRNYVSAFEGQTDSTPPMTVKQYRNYVKCAYAKSLQQSGDEECSKINIQRKYICITGHEVVSEAICSIKIEKSTKQSPGFHLIIVITSVVCALIVIVMRCIKWQYKRSNMRERQLTNINVEDIILPSAVLNSDCDDYDDTDQDLHQSLCGTDDNYDNVKEEENADKTAICVNIKLSENASVKHQSLCNTDDNYDNIGREVNVDKAAIFVCKIIHDLPRSENASVKQPSTESIVSESDIKENQPFFDAKESFDSRNSLDGEHSVEGVMNIENEEYSTEEHGYDHLSWCNTVNHPP